jgi:hypothetical protein
VFSLYSKGPSDTKFHQIDGRGHTLTIDNGWKDVAEVTPAMAGQQRTMTPARGGTGTTGYDTGKQLT